jgi:hypothetical protein
VYFDYAAAAHIDATVTSVCPYCVSSGSSSVGLNETYDEAATFSGWQPGSALSLSAKPTRWLTLSARWQHEPKFASVRTETYTALGLPASSGAESVQFQLPSLWTASAGIAAGRTVVVGEFVRVAYGNVFQPEYNCQEVSSGCPGWGISGFQTSDASLVRGGLEETFGLASGWLHLRGGAAFGPGYTLLLTSSQSLPLPVYPPRDNISMVTFGAAYEWAAAEFGVGVSVGNGQTRVLADLRVRLR